MDSPRINTVLASLAQCCTALRLGLLGLFPLPYNAAKSKRMMSTVPLWLALYVEAAAKADRRSVGQFITNAVIDQIGSSDPDQLRALFKRVVDGIKRLDHESQRAVALEFIDALHFCVFV